MNAAEQLARNKKCFGDEYPAALVSQGKRFPLREERRFSRIFEIIEEKRSFIISRFHDGSASLTFAELQQEWPGWDEKNRKDFCQNFGSLHEQADYRAMLRFVMQHGNPFEWSMIALPIATYLPPNEAYEFLVRALQATPLGEDTNFAQALAQTKNPEALKLLRPRHQTIWADPHLWDDHPFFNASAINALFSIVHLLELGAPPAEFEEQACQLSTHVCATNREFCRNHLAKYYSWLS